MTTYTLTGIFKNMSFTREEAIAELEANPNAEAWLGMAIAQSMDGDYQWAAQSFEKYFQCLEKSRDAVALAQFPGGRMGAHF